ncbi:MAG: triose-phosphate isomerase [Nanoarchaeota archaeon]|nr:triose-phosphate isomerase [Nanoarchaeota archaeon]
MRRPMIAANWKMNKTMAEARSFIDAFRGLVRDVTDVDIVLAPPSTLLCKLRKETDSSNIMLASQNMFYEDKGAFTGEISADMVKDFAEYVIIGHSERRQYFGESDDVINKKVNKALEKGLKVIFCMGETDEEREEGREKEVIAKQIKNGLDGVGSLDNVVVAYEPIWAIGTGKTATPEIAQEVHLFIRNEIRKIFGNETAEKIRILYGGSVKPGNAAELMEQPDIDGGLVGGASLDAEGFAQIVKFKG